MQRSPGNRCGDARRDAVAAANGLPSVSLGTFMAAR
jgi:hypothetical protein